MSTVSVLLLAVFLASDIRAADPPAPAPRQKGGRKAQPAAPAAQPAPAPTPAPTPATPAEAAPVPGPGYRLAWADEFDGAALDTTKWDHQKPG
jgi:hypothetical protein